MNEYIQAADYSADIKQKSAKMKKMPFCGKMIITFTVLDILLKILLGLFLTDGITAALSSAASFIITFLCIYGKAFGELSENAFCIEKNARGKVLGGTAKCVFATSVVTLLLGLAVKLTDLTGFDIFSQKIRVSVPLSGADGVIYCIYMCFLAPTMFELMFRGVVMRSLKSNGTKTSVIVSSLLFAFLHGIYITVIYAFVIGNVIGFSASKSKSLLTSVKIDILFSVIVYSLMAAVVSGIKYLYIPLIAITALFAVLGLLLTVLERLSPGKKQKSVLNFGELFSPWVIVSVVLMIAEDILFLFARG